MPTRSISVLLVNADATFTGVLRNSLLRTRGMNFSVAQKSTVEEALAAIRTDSSFDIVVTDYALPSSNGLEFCLQLNQLDRHIPVVMISSTKDVKLAVEVMKLGVEDFLLKDELDEAHVPRILVNILDRVQVRNQRRVVEKRMNIAENRAQAIRELVVTVCHEFNNPLAAIKISSDLLQRSPLSPAEQELLREFDTNFQKIESEVRRLRDLNFERIDFLNTPAPG